MVYRKIEIRWPTVDVVAAIFLQKDLIWPQTTNRETIYVAKKQFLNTIQVKIMHSYTPLAKTAK